MWTRCASTNLQRSLYIGPVPIQHPSRCVDPFRAATRRSVSDSVSGVRTDETKGRTSYTDDPTTVPQQHWGSRHTLSCYPR
jgi:hypothetical protein